MDLNVEQFVDTVKALMSDCHGSWSLPRVVSCKKPKQCLGFSERTFLEDRCLDVRMSTRKKNLNDDIFPDSQNFDVNKTIAETFCKILLASVV